MFDNGGDLVETSFLMEGLLAARQYFRGPSDAERDLYRRITQLWEAVEWDWYRGPPRRDRKSTRLNSSHLVISDAGFCLKKKKNIHTISVRLTSGDDRCNTVHAGM